MTGHRHPGLGGSGGVAKGRRREAELFYRGQHWLPFSPSSRLSIAVLVAENNSRSGEEAEFCYRVQNMLVALPLVVVGWQDCARPFSSTKNLFQLQLSQEQKSFGVSWFFGGGTTLRDYPGVRKLTSAFTAYLLQLIQVWLALDQ